MRVLRVSESLSWVSDTTNKSELFENITKRKMQDN